MTHDSSHMSQVITQIDAEGVEKIAGVTCFDCDKTWWKNGDVQFHGGK